MSWPSKPGRPAAAFAASHACSAFLAVTINKPEHADVLTDTAHEALSASAEVGRPSSATIFCRLERVSLQLLPATACLEEGQAHATVVTCDIVLARASCVGAPGP